jgi:DNA repair protein RadC
MKIYDFPQEERPRERLLKHNASALSNSELLAIILGIGTREKNVLELSKEILSIHDLEKLSDESVASIKKIPGIGLAKACQIVACFELGRRVTSYTKETMPLVTCPEDVCRILAAKLRLQKKEHLIGLFLDTRKRLIKEETIFIGTLDSSIIHPREILKAAIKESAAAIIIVHNHPSGDSRPSDEDIEITRQITKAAELVGIPLLDHVIIGENNYTSLRDRL